MIASIKMDIDNFFEQFRKKIDEVLDEATFIGLENIDELEDGTYTFLINIVIYEIAKNNQLSILVNVCKDYLKKMKQNNLNI